MRSRLEDWPAWPLFLVGCIATLIVDKNYAAVTAIANRNVILVKGRVVSEADSASLLAQRELLHRHLGV